MLLLFPVQWGLVVHCEIDSILCSALFITLCSFFSSFGTFFPRSVCECVEASIMPKAENKTRECVKREKSIRVKENKYSAFFYFLTLFSMKIDENLSSDRTLEIRIANSSKIYINNNINNVEDWIENGWHSTWKKSNTCAKRIDQHSKYGFGSNIKEKSNRLQLISLRKWLFVWNGVVEKEPLLYAWDVVK